MNATATVPRAGGRALVRALLLSLAITAPGSARGEEDGAADLDDLLVLDLAELMDVEIIGATKTLRRISEIPATVRVITAQQIRENGYRTLDEALWDLPGIQFRDMLGLNSYSFVRGVPNQNNLTLVLLDGIPINELNSGGFYGGAQYNLANVKRIEVIYGPASALYGTNAMSGIVNIVTFDPEDSPGFHASASYGTFETAHLDLRYAYHDPDRRFGFQVAGMGKTSELADLGGGECDHYWTSEVENFERDLAFDSKLTLRGLTAGVNYQNRRSSAVTYNPSVDTTYHEQDTLWNIRFLNAHVGHSWAIRDNLTWRNRGYFRDATVMSDSVLYVTDEGQEGRYRPNQLIGLETIVAAEPHRRLHLQGGAVLEAEWLAMGMSVTYSDDAARRPPRPEKPEMTHNRLISGFAQAQYLPVDVLQLSAGARFDYSNVYEARLNPRAGVVFDKDDVTLKLAYGEAFRGPKPWDYTDGLGNAELEPEKMRSLEFSASYVIADVLSIQAAVYRNWMDGVLVKETLGEDWRWINLGRVRTFGVEPGLELRVWRIRLYGNYTFTHSVDDDDERIREIAPHDVNFGLRFAFTDRIVLNLRGNVLGERQNPSLVEAIDSEFLPAAFVLHGSLSFLDFEGFDIQLIVRNITDAEYYHTSNRNTPRFRQPQRTVVLQATYRF